MKEKPITEVFRDNFLYYFRKTGKQQKELAEFLGISSPAITKWTKCTGLPQMDKLDALCDFLGCSRSQLVTERNVNIYEIYTDRKGNDFFRKYNQLNDAGVEQADRFLDFLLSDPTNKKGYRESLHA